MKLFKTISGRISAICSLFLVTAIVISFGVCYYIYSDMILDHLTENSTIQLEEIGGNIQSHLETTQDMAKTVSRLSTRMFDEGVYSDSLLQSIVNDLTKTPSVTHCGICLDSSLLARHGVTAPFHYADGLVQAPGLPSPNPEDRLDWFDKARQLHLGIWSHTQADSLSESEILATFVCPIYINHPSPQKAGEVVAQISRRQLRALLENTLISENSFNGLMTKKGNIKLHTHSELPLADNLLDHLHHEGIDDADQLFEYIVSSNEGVIPCRLLGTRGWFCFKNVLQTDWVVFNFIPLGDIYGPSFRIKLAFIVVGLICMLTFFIVLIRMLTRVYLAPFEQRSDQ